MLQIKAIHKQREMLNKSWENFLTRTSNYEALKVRNISDGAKHTFTV